MKHIISLLIALSAISMAHANFSEFTLDGVKYRTTFPFPIDSSLVEEYRKKAPWALGDGEPPIGPNKAYAMALSAFDEQFKGQLSVRVRFIVLRILGIQGYDFPYWEVVLVEEPTDDQIAKRREPDGRVPIANISYFIFMNGEIMKPEKA